MLIGERDYIRLRDAKSPDVCPAPPAREITPTYQVWWMRPYGRDGKYTAHAEFSTIDMDLAVEVAGDIIANVHEDPYDPDMHYVYVLMWDGHIPPKCVCDSHMGLECAHDAHRNMKRLVAAL